MTFVVFTAALVVVMVLGLVALNALLAQASFKIDDLQSRIDRLSRTHDERTLEAARLGSPARVAARARSIGMTLPGEGTQVLYVPRGSPRHVHARKRPNSKAVVGVRP